MSAYLEKSPIGKEVGLYSKKPFTAPMILLLLYHDTLLSLQHKDSLNGMF